MVHSLDAALSLQHALGTIIGGFHSPVERDCLKFLLKGSVQLIVCPARSTVGMRIPAEWKPAIASGRLTIRSPFDKGDASSTTPSAGKRPRQPPRRMTTDLAEQRNRFVASIADAVLILHASPGGKLDRLADELLASGKPVWTLDDPANAALIARGARPIRPEDVATIWAKP